MEVFKRNVRSKLPAPLKLDEAVATAIASGVTLDELRARASWFSRHQTKWPREHRPGVLYVGLKEARPGTPTEQGWPHQ